MYDGRGIPAAYRLAGPWIDDSLVLLEAPFNPQKRLRNSALLTVDLTKAVADEAIEKRQSIVVAYREHQSVNGEDIG